MNKLYLSYADVEGYVQHIARNIALSEWKPDYVVGVTRGGLFPALLLSQYFDVPMLTLNVSLRDGKTVNEENFQQLAQDAIYATKNFLIVDDINDTGATITHIISSCRESCMPDNVLWSKVFGSNIRFATVVDNESSEFNDVSYAGLEINKAVNDVWIVFPWEDWWK